MPSLWAPRHAMGGGARLPPVPPCCATGQIAACHRGGPRPPVPRSGVPARQQLRLSAGRCRALYTSGAVNRNWQGDRVCLIPAEQVTLCYLGRPRCTGAWRGGGGHRWASRSLSAGSCCGHVDGVHHARISEEGEHIALCRAGIGAGLGAPAQRQRLSQRAATGLPGDSAKEPWPTRRWSSSRAGR